MVDPATGLLDFQCRKLAAAIGLAHRRSPFVRAAQAARAALQRQGRPPARDQPARGHRGGRLPRARLQDRVRRQRAVPPGRGRRAARLRRGGPEGGRGLRPRAQLHRARRAGRLHRERRGARDGHDGRDRPARRPPGQLPGRRRWGVPGEGGERVPDRARGPERARDPREHLRGDQPVRLDRDRHRAGHEDPGDRGPDRRAPGRHERRGGSRDPRGERPRVRARRGPRRRGAEGGGRRRARGRLRGVPKGLQSDRPAEVPA